jgi:crotonobetainyl-CoA:carnitine CoA-transferase CaiB-like acyl-CoA transferase
MTLNLRTDEGKEVFRDLVRNSDVLVENFTAHAMDRLGLGYADLKEINPRLIYASLSGFGHDDLYEGPYSERPAFNLIAQAMSGIMDITGELGGPPIPTGVAMGDLVAGVFTLSGILLALRMRETTQRGQHVDISMYDCLTSFSQRAIQRTYLTGEVPTRGDDQRDTPQGPFKVKDGYIVMSAMGDAMWDRLCTMIGHPEIKDDPRFNPEHARGRAFDDEIKPILEEWAQDKTRDEVVDLFTASHLPAASVQNSRDLLECPQLEARNMIQRIDDPNYGAIVVTGNPIKLSALREAPFRPAPLLGEHTAEILNEVLKLSPVEIEDLRAKGAV